MVDSLTVGVTRLYAYLCRERVAQTYARPIRALFNPLGWMSSAARSSTTFSNLFISIALFDAVDGEGLSILPSLRVITDGIALQATSFLQHTSSQ